MSCFPFGDTIERSLNWVRRYGGRVLLALLASG